MDETTRLGRRLVTLRRALAGVAIGLAASMLVSCGGGGAPPAPPSLTAQPQAIVVADGGTASFSVTASGAPPMTYQWSKNGAAIAGATAATYTTPPLTLVDNAAQFGVTVTNIGGSVVSPSATVTVTAVAPSIDVAPLDQVVADGAAATFSVHAKGSQPLTYQWFRGGLAVPGANSSSITLNAAGLADDAASFSVQVGNVAGQTMSALAGLKVTPVAAHIATQPSAQTVLDGAAANFSVLASGTAPLSYQWYANGVPLAGATNASYSMPVTYADSGTQYKVVVSNAYGSQTSGLAPLTVDPRAPSISSQPQDVNLQTGDTATFSVSAGGTGPLGHQWERSTDSGRSWSSIPGATASAYVLPDLTLSAADTLLRVRVSNMAGQVLSGAVALRVAPKVHLIAGAPGGPGYADGMGAAARFNTPTATAVDAQGNVLVADGGNLLVRRVTPDGVASTVAGQWYQSGTTDGGAAHATFLQVHAMAFDGAGNLYIGAQSQIRKLSPSGVVSTVAGQMRGGGGDGSGTTAQFSDVVGIVADAAGNLVVADGGSNQTVRSISQAGVVTTLAGNAGQTGFVDGPGAAARFSNLNGIATDGSGNVWVTDGSTVRKIAADGTVSLYAGSPTDQVPVDGQRLSARFNTPRGLVFDGAGNLYVADWSTIRRIAPDGSVSTLAGGALTNDVVDMDGLGQAAAMQNPSGLALSSDGSKIYFASLSSHNLRSVTLDGMVSTLAGPKTSLQDMDGPGTAARFGRVGALAADAQGNILLTEGHPLRRIDPSGHVSTLPLSDPNFVNITAITFSPAGAAYVVDAQAQQVARLTPDGTVVVVAGIANVSGHDDGAAAQATFNSPQGVAVDAAGNVFVADTMNSTIRKIDPAGNVTTIAGINGVCGSADGVGTAASFCHPAGMVVDAQGRLYVADDWSYTVRRVDPDGHVTTVGGVPFASGHVDGLTSTFWQPLALALDAEDNLYVADRVNALVRRITPSGYASTVIGQSGIAALWPGPAGAINSPLGLAMLPSGHLVLATEFALVGD